MNDLIKSINLRLNNPFILTFCISWIFWNWPITIGLLWYNSTTLPQYGYSNYKELIFANSDFLKNFLGPILVAIAYPFLKWGFNLMQTWVASKEEKTIKKVSSEGYIPTLKYLKVIEKYDLDVKKLSEIIEKESETIEANASLHGELALKNNYIAEYKRDIEITRKYSTNIFLEGIWEVSIKKENQEKIFNEIVSFDPHGRAYKAPRENNDVIDYVPIKIVFFSYNAIINSGVLIINNTSINQNFIFINCKFDEKFILLEDKQMELNSLIISIRKHRDGE